MNISAVNELYKNNMESNTVAKSNSANSKNYINSADLSGSLFDSVEFSKGGKDSDPYDRVAGIASEDNSGENSAGTSVGNAQICEEFSKEMIDKLGQVAGADEFDMYEELGIAPDKDDPAHIVTVSERIEIELATYCEDYKPAGNISMDDIKTMYGDSGMAYQVASELQSTESQILYGEDAKEKVEDISDALSKIENIKASGINASASEYLLVNGKSLTIDNVYMAVHSVAQGSVQATNNYSQISDEEWNSLSAQAETLLDKNGIEVNQDTMGDAKWLVENKIPMTAENVYKMSQIRDINNSLGETDIQGWTDKIATDLSITGSAGEVTMDYYSTVSADSMEAMTIIENGTPDQVETLVNEGKEVNLLNMKRLQEDRVKLSQKNQSNTENEKNQKKLVASRRALEELRIKMTVEAGAIMIKNGINIDLTPMEDMVEELKGIENKLSENIFSAIGYEPETSEIQMMSDVNTVMQSFGNAPSYVLGEVLNGTVEFQVQAVAEAGTVRADILNNMLQTYDTLGTKPDRELGDSLKAAFSGIDNMLSDLGYEDNVVNERAVRILAYNQMEITSENIDSIKNMDAQVSRLIENMTPRTVAYLISNGINPLRTNIDTLNTELDKINAEIDADGLESYSEYLYKLDKNKEISEEDREAYIGIYKILNMIEKGDRRAVGAVSKSGGSLTMRNLMTAIRSRSNAGNDITVDDNTGLTESVTLGDNNLDKLLAKLENSPMLKSVKDKILPDQVSVESLDVKKEKDQDSILDKPVDEFVEKMYDTLNSGMTEDESISYGAEKGEDINNLSYVSQAVFENILEDNMPQNMSNILGLSYLLGGGKNIFDRINDTLEDSKIKSDIDALGEDAAVEAGEKLNADIKTALYEKSNISSKDIRQITGAANYISKARNNNSYYVNLDMDGENMLVKFTLNADDNSSENSAISIKLYQQEKTVEASISMNENGIILGYSQEETVFADTDKMEALSIRLNEIFAEEKDRYASKKTENISGMDSESTNEQTIDNGIEQSDSIGTEQESGRGAILDNSGMFRLAKAFLAGLR